MTETNDKVFRGVWIPVEVWEAHSLSWMEKCLWAEISSLGTEEKPCFASNAYLAKIFNSTESSISNMISKLKSLGMIRHLSYDGRNRKIIAILPSGTSPTGEVRLHSQVKSDSTAGCSIDTKRVSKRGRPPIIPTKPSEVPDEIWQAWCDHRKAKNARVTDSIIEILRREADRAGWSLTSAMEECILRNWQGFKAEWLTKSHKTSQSNLL